MWWTGYPTANVALGPGSGTIALNVDGPDAPELLEDLFGADGLPPTMGFTTPGGGRRLFYAVSPDCNITRKRSDRGDSHVILLGKGCETVRPSSAAGRAGKARYCEKA